MKTESAASRFFAFFCLLFAVHLVSPMEISDELLRRIIREAVRELGGDADPALLRKVVKDVIRRLQQEKDQPQRKAQP